MSGFGGRDESTPAQGVHDELQVHALYVSHYSEQVVILSFDLLFFSRENADALKAALGRELDLLPRQILLNTSHTHSGPCVDTWGHNGFVLPDISYLRRVERATIEAATVARDRAVPANLEAGMGRSTIPVSRRKPDGKGGVEWRPYPEGEVCRHLPVTLLRGSGDGEPICLLYSISCHPSTTGGGWVSADYPGATSRRLDAHIGKECAMFLQGAGGDSKARVIADGRDDQDVCWRSGSWDDIEEAGNIAAREVIAVLDAGLSTRRPRLRAALREMEWPLQPPPGAEELREAAAGDNRLRRLWATRQLAEMERGYPMTRAVPLLFHEIRIADDVNIVAVEGELVGQLGCRVSAARGEGITFALGYSNGMGMYLPTSEMLKEGGYEAASYYEYGLPSPLAPGIEARLDAALAVLNADLDDPTS